MERRYRDFVHLHNAQLGNADPLSVDEIVTEISRRENAKNGHAKKGIKSVQIAQDLKSGKVSVAEYYDVVRRNNVCPGLIVDYVHGMCVRFIISPQQRPAKGFRRSYRCDEQVCFILLSVIFLN